MNISDEINKTATATTAGSSSTNYNTISKSNFGIIITSNLSTTTSTVSTTATKTIPSTLSTTNSLTTTITSNSSIVDSSNINNNNNNNNISSNCNNGNSTSSSGSNNNNNSQSGSISSSTGPPNCTERQIESWDDRKLKALLDEAYSYKNPKDRENKSEIFLQLLENVEKEKETTFPFMPPRYTRSNNSREHGGSLQDLVESVNSDLLLDSDNFISIRNRRHHNSRTKKYSSVSSRQREGGSLPSNVNVSNCNLSIYEHPFLNEVNKQHGIGGRGVKNERTCSGTSYTSGTSSNSTCGYESIKDNDFLNNNCVNSISGDTIIDIGENYSEDRLYPTEDSIYMGSMTGSSDYDVEPIIKFPRVKLNASLQAKLELGHPEEKVYVDEPITFSSLERSKSNADSTCISLNENYPSCKSIMGEKAPPALFTTTKNIPKQFDENGNSLNSTFTTTTNSACQSQAKAKKKKSQSERNTKTIEVESVAGYRGKDPVEDLVKYIEDTDINKKTEKNSKINDNINNNKKKDKKKDKDLKKLKKSNSLEELRSCTKLDEDDTTKISALGNNRKQQQSHSNKLASNINSNLNISPSTTIATTPNTGTADSPNTKHKRSERRSWGTEELTYLGENNAIEEVREKIKEKEKKKNRDSQQNQISTTQAHLINDSSGQQIKLDKIEKLENSIIKRPLTTPVSFNKKEETNSTSMISLTESSQFEAAEFLVVTKKKKSKKRQSNDTDRPTHINNNCNNSTYNKNGKEFAIHNQNTSNNNYQQKKYQVGSNDSYLSSFEEERQKKKKSRRKSTSSMPPSEKSDSSDLESVHSLPIESSSNRHFNNSTSSTTMAANDNNSSGNPNAIKSYADMARTKLSSSLGNNNPVNNNKITAQLAPSAKNVSKKSSNVKEFPNLLSLNDGSGSLSSCNSSSSSTNNAILRPQISYSQSLGNANSSMASSCGNDMKLTDSLTNLPENFIEPTDVQQNICNNKTPNSKQTLQKSKSVDNENMLNNDQYPALEKTIKRHAATQVVTIEQTLSTTVIKPHLESKILDNNSINDIKNNTSSSNNNNLGNINSNNNNSNLSSGNKKIMKNMSTTTTTTSESTMSPPLLPLVSSNYEIRKSINKTEQQSLITNRKIKKEFKNNSQQNLTSISNSRKSLPAVIMLNDPNPDPNQMNILNTFTFGDFKEEELQFYNDEINSGNIDTIESTDVEAVIDEIASSNCDIDSNLNSTELHENNNNSNNLIESNLNSSHSDDCGYSSTISIVNNRSHLSEELEASPKLSSTILEDVYDNQITTTITKTNIANYNNNIKNMTHLGNENNNCELNTTSTNIDSINNKCKFKNNSALNNNYNNTSNDQHQQSSKDHQQTKSNLNEKKSLSSSYLDSNNQSISNNISTYDNLENRKKSKKFLYNVRYVQPSNVPESNEQLINFVGSAWDEIVNSNANVEFYNGQ